MYFGLYSKVVYCNLYIVPSFPITYIEFSVTIGVVTAFFGSSFFHLLFPFFDIACILPLLFVIYTVSFVAVAPEIILRFVLYIHFKSPVFLLRQSKFSSFPIYILSLVTAGALFFLVSVFQSQSISPFFLKQYIFLSLLE